MENFSAIQIVTKGIRIALPAANASNEMSGICDVLKSAKGQYLKELQGILISYKNVSVTSNSGLVAVEKPVIYYNVTATFEIFCPAVGNILSGKIDHVCHEHIGCLLHNTVRAEIDPCFHTSNDISHLIKIGREIFFQMTSFHFCRKVIGIEGIINDACVRLMKELPSFNTRNDVESVILTEGTVDNERQAENIESINSSIKESNSPGLLSSGYSRLSKSNLFIHNNNKNFLNNNDNEKSGVEASLNHKQNYIDNQECKSAIFTSLPSTLSESDSSSNLFRSPPTQVSDLKKKKYKSKYQHTNLSPQKENYLQPQCIVTSDMKHKHKKLTEKPEDVSMKESLIDFEISKDFKEKKSTRKSSILSKTELNNLTTSDAYISLPKLKSSTKKLYNGHLHEKFNRLPEGTLSSSKFPKKVSSDKGVHLATSTFPFSLLHGKDMNSIEQEPNEGEERIEESCESKIKELSDSTKVEQETSEICKTHSGKMEKKRKQALSENSGPPKKKNETQANSVGNKNKLHKQKKSKKKHKGKSKKNSKKINAVDDLVRPRERLLEESSKNEKKKLGESNKKKKMSKVQKILKKSSENKEKKLGKMQKILESNEKKLGIVEKILKELSKNKKKKVGKVKKVPKESIESKKKKFKESNKNEEKEFTQSNEKEKKKFKESSENKKKKLRKIQKILRELSKNKKMKLKEPSDTKKKKLKQSSEKKKWEKFIRYIKNQMMIKKRNLKNRVKKKQGKVHEKKYEEKSKKILRCKKEP